MLAMITLVGAATLGGGMAGQPGAGGGGSTSASGGYVQPPRMSVAIAVPPLTGPGGGHNATSGSVTITTRRVDGGKIMSETTTTVEGNITGPVRTGSGGVIVTVGR